MNFDVLVFSIGCAVFVACMAGMIITGTKKKLEEKKK